MSSSRLWALAAAALLLTAAPAHADPPAPAGPAAPLDGAWHEGDPVPTGYHVVRRYQEWLVATGASLFVASYLASAVAANTGYLTVGATVSARSNLWVPFAGPFIMLGDATTTRATGALLVLDGLAQLGGATMFLYGLATPAKVLMKNEPAARPAAISLGPLLARKTSGIMVNGTF
jgi:hypothetical protein